MIQPDSYVRSLLKRSPGERVTARGWVKTRRDSKNVHFIQLNDGSSPVDLQIVLDAGVVSEDEIAKITTGACISVEGELVASMGKGQAVELKALALTADDLRTAPAEETVMNPLRAKTVALLALGLSATIVAHAQAPISPSSSGGYVDGAMFRALVDDGLAGLNLSAADVEQTEQGGYRSDGRQEHQVFFEHGKFQCSGFFHFFLDRQHFLLGIEFGNGDHFFVFAQTGFHYVSYAAFLAIAFGNSTIHIFVGQVILNLADEFIDISTTCGFANGQKSFYNKS
jgi:hypothetical protein